MTEDMVQQFVSACLVMMGERLEKAVARARSAEGCISPGTRDVLLQIALDIEILTCEVNVLLNAASLVHRIAADLPTSACRSPNLTEHPVTIA